MSQDLSFGYKVSFIKLYSVTVRRSCCLFLVVADSVTVNVSPASTTANIKIKDLSKSIKYHLIWRCPEEEELDQKIIPRQSDGYVRDEFSFYFCHPHHY